MSSPSPTASPTRTPPAAPSGSPNTPVPARSSRSKAIRKRVWTLGRLFVLLLALGLTFGAFFLTAMRVTIKAREVEVPDLRGVTVSEATNTLSRLGLVLRVDQPKVPDPKVKVDHILSQEPSPKSILRRQRAVRVRVSDGMREALIPAVAGQSERTAEATLEGAHIAILGRAEVKSSTYPNGTVIAQDPPAGARAAGVMLLVNRTEEGQSYVVPDLFGMPYQTAVRILRQSPLRLVLSGDQFQPNLPSGTIINQVPQPGSKIGPADFIQVWTVK